MTESASTPRLRTTFAIYVALVAATAIVGPREIPAGWHYLAGAAGFVCVALACLGRIWCSVFIAGHKDEKLIAVRAVCTVPPSALLVIDSRRVRPRPDEPLRVAVHCRRGVDRGAGGVRGCRAKNNSSRIRFPEEFKAYVAATPNKWWPRFAARAIPEHLDVKPAIFWKALVDAGSFFLLYLLVALAAEYRISPIF